MNIGGIYGKEKEQETDVLRGWKRLDPAIQSRVPPPTEDDWDLDPAVAAKVLAKKKNWSAPGPDRLANSPFPHVP